MKKLLDPAYWARALRNPVVLAGLAVDLLPVIGVFLWGWGAAALVLLYWMENVIAGVMTLPRILISGASFGGFGILAGLVLCAFFIFHYGLFCAVHGSFLMAFLAISSGPDALNTTVMMDMPAMFGVGLSSGQHIVWMVGLICGWQLFVFGWEFIAKGSWRETSPIAEMFAPYQRIVVMHFAIFAGAGALFLLGEPMIGVLGLILIRALFGVMNNSAIDEKAPFSEANMPTRAQFEAALKGKPEAP